MTQHSCSQQLVVNGRPTCCCVLHNAPAARNQPPPIPVVLLHGLGCSSPVWEPGLAQFARLTPTQAFYAPDLPGYGGSQGPPKALSMQELAGWTADFMDALALPKAHIIAHSMGCQVALALAKQRPDRVETLVLAGPTLGAPATPLWRCAAGLVADAFREPLRYQAKLVRMTAAMGLRRYAVTVQRMMNHDALAHIERVVAPCLVVRGAQDPIISDVLARQLAVSLPKGAFVRIPNAAHAVPYSQPTAFVTACLRFWNHQRAGA